MFYLISINRNDLTITLDQRTLSWHWSQHYWVKNDELKCPFSVICTSVWIQNCTVSNRNIKQHPANISHKIIFTCITYRYKVNIWCTMPRYLSWQKKNGRQCYHWVCIADRNHKLWLKMNRRIKSEQMKLELKRQLLK